MKQNFLYQISGAFVDFEFKLSDFINIPLPLKILKEFDLKFSRFQFFNAFYYTIVIAHYISLDHLVLVDHIIPLNKTDFFSYLAIYIG